MDSSSSLLPPPSLPTAPNNKYHFIIAPTLSNVRGIFVRAVTIVLLVVVSLWANHEASKGFDLTIHSASNDTPAGRRFDLMFVSNGKAATLLLESSYAIEHIIYPRNLFVKKPVHHVILKLSGEKTTEIVQVKRGYKKEKPGEYLILVKPEIVEEENATVAMAAALYRAMAYVWLWDGTTTTQRSIVDAMAEYLTVQSGFDGVPSKTSSSSFGSFMQKCEKLSHGFVARLNNVVHERLWRDGIVDRALDQMLQELCLEHLQLASF